MTELRQRRIPQTIAAHYDLWAPRDAKALLVALHGYAGNKDSMMALARRIAGEDLAVASLQGPHEHIVEPEEKGAPLRYAFGWLTNFHPEDSIARHHAALLAILDAASSEGVPARPVFLLGFSQSVALNFRFAFTHPERLAGVVGVCGNIPGDFGSEGKYRDASFDVLLIGGERDDYYPPARLAANAEALRRRARRVDLEVLAGGHEFMPAALPLIGRWLRERI